MFFEVLCTFFASKAKFSKNEPTGFTALFGSEELDKNHANRISVAQMRLF